MVIFVNSENKSWNLGLVRIIKKKKLKKNEKKGEILYKDITRKLNSFDLDWKDIVGINTDGAGTNDVIARCANVTIQKCIAHAMQNAIKATLYEDEIISSSINELGQSFDFINDDTEEESDESDEEDEDESDEEDEEESDEEDCYADSFDIVNFNINKKVFI